MSAHFFYFRNPNQLFYINRLSMKIAPKTSNKSTASSSPRSVRGRRDVSLKPVSSVDWAETAPDADWVIDNARHNLSLGPNQALPVEKSALLRAAINNYSKQDLILAIVSARGGKLPKQVPQSKETAIIDLMDIIFKRNQLDATLTSIASSVPATDANPGDATPTGSVVTLSPSKKRNCGSGTTGNR